MTSNEIILQKARIENTLMGIGNDITLHTCCNDFQQDVT